MKEKLAGIEEAISYKDAIEIVPVGICEMGVWALKFEFVEKFGHRLDDVVVVPIKKGGIRIGAEIAGKLPVAVAPMRMSYYDEKNNRLKEPICKSVPDMRKIIVEGRVRDVVFAEGVVESEATIKKSMEVINGLVDFANRKLSRNYPYPNYHVFALVSKINGEATIPDFVYSIKVDNRIWVHGWGVDNGQKGRDLNYIAGVLAPHADGIPQRPYFEVSEAFNRNFVIK